MTEYAADAYMHFFSNYSEKPEVVFVDDLTRLIIT